MRLLLITLLFVPVSLFAQATIKIESHTFDMGSYEESHSYFGEVYLSDSISGVLHLKNIVSVSVFDGNRSIKYIINGNYLNFSQARRNRECTIVFTDKNGDYLFWYVK